MIQYLPDIGDKVVVPAVVTPGPGNAVIKLAALQIFAKRLADIGLGGVVVALPVELTSTGEIKPGYFAATSGSPNQS